MPSARITDAVRLLDVDPELGALLDDPRYEAAARALVVRTHRLPIGPWKIPGLTRTAADHLGLLIVEGVLCRELVIAGHASPELLGPGDLVRPWQPRRRVALLPVAASWSALSPVTLAILDCRLGRELARYPEINAVLMERLSERSERLATAQAISQLTGVERRLIELFWHLAERWGRVSSEGVLVPLALSHQLLGQLVGARRSTVSAALAALGDRGELERRRDGAWLLCCNPPVAAASAARTAGAARRQRY